MTEKRKWFSEGNLEFSCSVTKHRRDIRKKERKRFNLLQDDIYHGDL